jgi:3-deoxy-7-phosphoheptulonate synthase
MIIVLKPDVTEVQIENIMEKIKKMGLSPHLSKGMERTIIGVIGDERILSIKPLEAFPGVEKILPVLKPFKLASRDFKRENTVINVNGVLIGGNEIVVMAGPCSVESKEQILEIARIMKDAGVKILRGGAYKPRTSPYSFQGLGREGLEYLALAKEEVGINIVTEVMDPRDVDLVAQYSDILQIGARNMQNFPLLKEVGKLSMPVLLKRGASSTINEFLMAAEYIMVGGNHNVMLCERGIRGFDSEYTRNILDISAIAVIKEISHLPIIIDPSHGGGNWKWIPSLSKAAVAAGCDGLIVEVHSNPEEALSDGEQSLKPDSFKEMLLQIKEVAKAVGRSLV